MVREREKEREEKKGEKGQLGKCVREKERERERDRERRGVAFMRAECSIIMSLIVILLHSGLLHTYHYLSA
jgi:hypothetical protein